jgi:2-oxoglutarate dehydrogenase E2 component (dihydrolipoamide succinyltransferase)
MSTEVRIPEIGESVTQGIISAWLKAEGDTVNEGEDLFELETDKATLAVPSPAAGVLSIIAGEGEEVGVGQVVAAIDEAGMEREEAGAPKKPSKQTVEFEINIDDSITGAGAAGAPAPAEPDVQPERTAPAAGAPLSAAAGAPSSPGPTAPPEAAGDTAPPPLSPSVRRIVEQYDLDPRSITGTGKDGRITKKDALEAVEQRGGGAAEAGPTGAAPAAAAVPKTEERAETPPAAAGQGAAVSPGQNRVKMTTIRKRIAENLLQARQGAAHVTTFNEIDMSAVINLRKSYRESFEKQHGVRLGFMSFFVKACCNALAAHPLVNAWIDGEDIVYNNYFNIGIAVSTERGLIVPVIRDADRMGFAEIERTIRDFAGRAREKKLTVDDLSGGTFTITNGGVFGSMLSTPIPSPPQSAILGMHAIKERPVAVDGEVVVRPVMYAALTYDHRLIDGSEAVTFLVRVKESIEDPQRILIDT